MSAVTKKKFTPASKASGMTFGTPTRPRQIGLTPTGDVPSWYLSVRRGHVRRAAAAERRGALEPRLLLRGEETTFADRVMNGAVRSESPRQTESRKTVCRAAGRSQGTGGPSSLSVDRWHARTPGPRRRFACIRRRHARTSHCQDLLVRGPGRH